MVSATDHWGVIRVLIVDDHPAVRAGLESVLRTEAGIAPVAACGSVAEAETLAERVRPQVAVVDYELGDGNGLDLCMRLYPAGVRTLVFSAFGEKTLAAAAQLAGASGLLHKAAAGDELSDAIRCVARDMRMFPPLGRDVLELLAGRLDPEDLSILGMTIEGSTREDVAEALRLDPGELERRLRGMVARVRPRTGGRKRLSQIA